MDQLHHKCERKTVLVVIFTAITMVIEIIFGLNTKSMALPDDGIHKGPHLLAKGLSWLAYVIIPNFSKRVKFTGNTSSAH